MDLIEANIGNPIEHWYYKHKFWFIASSESWKRESDISLVDIGAGSAVFSKELLRQNVVASCVAVDTGYSEDSEDPELCLSYRRFSEYKGFTHFLLTDVLEHVEQDLDFLRDIVSKADIDSSFIITVPAFMSLWSGHDVYLKHCRRYSKSELEELAIKSGLVLQSIRYTYSTLFPIAWLQRKFLNRKSTNSHLKENGYLLDLFLKLLLIPDRWIPSAPFGISLFMEAIKDGK